MSKTITFQRKICALLSAFACECIYRAAARAAPPAPPLGPGASAGRRRRRRGRRPCGKQGQTPAPARGLLGFTWLH